MVSENQSGNGRICFNDVVTVDLCPTEGIKGRISDSDGMKLNLSAESGVNTWSSVVDKYLLSKRQGVIHLPQRCFQAALVA